MSQFYARYVPPSKSVKSNATEERQNKKRKLNDSVERSPQPVSTATIDNTKSTPAAEQRHSHKPKKENETLRVNGDKSGSTHSGHNILDKYRITEFAKAQDGQQDIKVRAKVQSTHESRRSKTKAPKGVGEQQTPKAEENGQLDQYDNSIGSRKHASIASKLSKSKQTTTPTITEKNIESRSKPEIPLHGLEPIPQPAPIEKPNIIPAYAVLPAWQSAATAVDPSIQQSFEQMSLSKGLLANLHKNGIKDAFPVQSKVVPMLLDERMSTRDLCISAATGSGKTLAYTIPIIEALGRQKRSGLRAIIVVPTRELVKQVSETCHMCASGADISIVTSLGSKALSEEKDLLIAIEEIYDPRAYANEQNAPVDWSTFSFEKMLKEVNGTGLKLPPGFVMRTRIKPNILVTTPGRLVDHLKNTKGFHLDDVEWMVVDEADRLLNESYQEWIDTVIPALSSRATTKERDRILSSMHMNLPPRIVRKILLSATMTRDITKLNSLGLVDPELIVLQTSGAETRPKDAQDTIEPKEEPQADINGQYSLPNSLSETAITFKDGADKPLVLLNLLEQIIPLQQINGKVRTSTDDNTSDSDSSSDSDSESDTTMSSSSASSSDEDDTSSDDSSTAPSPNNSTNLPPKRSSSNSTLLPRALIFTRSTSSALRLSRLLTLLSPNLTPHLSTLTKSHLSSSASRAALRSFTSPTSPTRILIATDRASRGIDIPGLDHVVNYDVPGSALTYVHRVGRTARAGKEGKAWTLVEFREGRWFWGCIGGKGATAGARGEGDKDEGVGNGNATGNVKNVCEIRRDGGRKVEKVEVKIEDEGLREKYERALESLGREVNDA